MGPDNETLEWNILEDAREKGMVEAWGVGVSAEEVAKEAAAGELAESMQAGAEAGMEVDENGAGPSTAPQPLLGLGLGMGFADEDAEEIARRLEEKYGDEDNKKKKVAVSLKIPLCMRESLADMTVLRSRERRSNMILTIHLSMILRSSSMPLLTSLDPRRRASSSMPVTWNCWKSTSLRCKLSSSHTDAQPILLQVPRQGETSHSESQSTHIKRCTCS